LDIAIVRTAWHFCISFCCNTSYYYNLPQITGKLYHIMLYQVHLAMSGIQTHSGGAFRIWVKCQPSYTWANSVN
jgi:hypothetical protein